MTDEEFLLSEYGSNLPTRLNLEGKELIVPASYKGDIDAFTDDLTSFQNNEYKKYERHNEKNPDNSIEPVDIISDEGLHVIVPLSYAKKDIFDENGIIKPKYQKRILQEFYQKAFKHYCNAIKKTKRYKREYPHKDIKTSLSQCHLSECSKSHIFYIIGKTAKAVAKATKWTSKEAVNIAVGTAASPLALVYKFMDKKHRIAESSKKQWIDEKALPYIKRGVLKAMVVAMSYGGIKVHSVYDKYQEEKAKIELQKSKERAEKEAFFKKYNTNNETFYQNYKIAKENEAMIVALIACPEGFKSEAYLCSAGKPTKGYGTTRTIKKDKDGNIEYDEKGFAKTIPVVLGTTTTKEDGYDDVVAHLEKYVYPQLEHINKILESQEIAAVCMFIYNTDEGAFKDSMLCVAINNDASDEKIREAFSIIRSVGGLRSYGLINRHGFEGYVFCCENIKDLIDIKPTIAGSPDITYYEYGTKNKKDPLENADKTFVVRDIEEVKKDAEKFKTDNYSKCIVCMLPQEKAQEVLNLFGIHIDENGKITRDITWEEAQEIAKQSTKGQEKTKKNKKQSAKQSRLTCKINKNTSRR